MAEAGRHGVSGKTPKRIVWGAATVHRGLKKESNTWNFDTSIMGATKGGVVLTITPEYTSIGADGAMVAYVGDKVKTGEVAKVKIAALELTSQMIADAAGGNVEAGSDTEYEVIKPVAGLTQDSYAENIAIVGTTVEGNKCIAILPNALCVSGLELGTEHKNSASIELEYECHADPDTDLNVLPWEIYWPVSAK